MMRYLIVIIGFMFASCEKGELGDCRDCVVTETNLNTNQTTVESFVDCRNIIREETRTYLAGSVMYHKVVRCNPPK
jgi:hypothetical protein